MRANVQMFLLAMGAAMLISNASPIRANTQSADAKVMVKAISVSAARRWVAAASADKKFVVTGSYDGELTIWDAATGMPVAQTSYSDERIESVRFKGRDSIVVFSTLPKPARVKVREVDGNSLRTKIERNVDISYYDIFDGKYAEYEIDYMDQGLSVVCIHSSLYLRYKSKLRPICEPSISEGSILAGTVDGTKIVFGENQKEIFLLDENKRSLKLSFAANVVAAQFSPSGNYYAIWQVGDTGYLVSVFKKFDQNPNNIFKESSSLYELSDDGVLVGEELADQVGTSFFLSLSDNDVLALPVNRKEGDDPNYPYIKNIKNNRKIPFYPGVSPVNYVEWSGPDRFKIIAGERSISVDLRSLMLESKAYKSPPYRGAAPFSEMAGLLVLPDASGPCGLAKDELKKYFYSRLAGVEGDDEKDFIWYVDPLVPFEYSFGELPDGSRAPVIIDGVLNRKVVNVHTVGEKPSAFFSSYPPVRIVVGTERGDVLICHKMASGRFELGGFVKGVGSDANNIFAWNHLNEIVWISDAGIQKYQHQHAIRKVAQCGGSCSGLYILDDRSLSKLRTSPSGPVLQYQISIADPSVLNATHTVSVSPDGKWLMTIGESAEVAIFRQASNGQMRYFGKFFVGHSGYLLMVEEGYFSIDGSEQLNRLRVISKDKAAQSIGAYFDIFHRPDIVRAKLRGENIRPLIGDLTIEKALQNPPPKIEVKSIADSTNATHLKIPYTITPDTGGVAEVRIFQNGKLISSDGTYKDAPGKTYAPVAGKSADAGRYAEANLQRNAKRVEESKDKTNTLRDQLIVRGAPEKKCTPGKAGDPCKGEIEVDVIPGEENTITVVAFNRDNTIQSVPASVSFKSTLPKEDPHLWVIGVGIDQFANISALKNAHKDAQDFICTYAGKEQVSKIGVACAEDGKAKTLFKPQNIHVVDALFDAQATKGNILAALDKVARQARPGDTFVWFVASHGMMDANSNFGIVAHDTQCLNDNCTDIKGHLTSNEILEASKKIKAMKQLVVLDTCHSGGLDSKLSGLYDARVSLLAKNMGLHLYASAQATEAAQDGKPGSNGTFTAQLLEGIKGAAPKNQEGQISVMTLGDYAKQKTIEATQPKSGTKDARPAQTPVIQHFGQDAGLVAVGGR